MDLNQFDYVTFARVVKARDGDTTEVFTLKQIVKGEKTPTVVRFPGVNTPETGVPYAAEAKAMLEKFIAGSGGWVMQVAFDRGGNLSGDRVRWHTLCQDPETEEWFNPAVKIARAGYATPFSQFEEWAFNEAIMIAAQKAMRDKLGMWSNPDPRFEVRCIYNPAGGDGTNECVDIFNRTDKIIPIGNWSLRSDGAWGEKQQGYRFPADAHIDPNGKARLWVGRKGEDNRHGEFFWGNVPDAPLATFKNPNEDIKSGGMAILMRPLPDMVPAAWHVWPNRL